MATVNGTWRSLVARFLGVEEVAGSNPVVPIRIPAQDEKISDRSSSALDLALILCRGLLLS